MHKWQRNIHPIESADKRQDSRHCSEDCQDTNNAISLQV